MARGSAVITPFFNPKHVASVTSTQPHSDPSADTQQVSQTEFEQLKQQATRLEHLLQVMPAGVVVVNGKGQVKQANALARSLLGEPLEGQMWRAIIARSFRPQADDGHEVSLHDGRKVKLSITPLVGEPGQLIVLTDLTETRMLQQRVSHMQRLSALGKTVASMVHQIRTPLSAAILYAANLKNKNLTPQAQERFCDKLQSRLHELESQVNDMLLFAKSGEQQVVQPLDVDALLGELAASSEDMLQDSNGQLIVEPCPLGLTVLGNQPALIGALQNLIHNGIQMQQNSPWIHIQVQDNDKNIAICVTDRGPGIEAGMERQIFEPFYTSKSQGTGLGLAVVNTVAKSHGGSASAHNTAQGGARFVLNIPKYTVRHGDVNQIKSNHRVGV